MPHSTALGRAECERCETGASVEIDGEALCGTHAKEVSQE